MNLKTMTNLYQGTNIKAIETKGLKTSNSIESASLDCNCVDD